MLYALSAKRIEGSCELGLRRGLVRDCISCSLSPLYLCVWPVLVPLNLECEPERLAELLGPDGEQLKSKQGERCGGELLLG